MMNDVMGEWRATLALVTGAVGPGVVAGGVVAGISEAQALAVVLVRRGAQPIRKKEVDDGS